MYGLPQRTVGALAGWLCALASSAGPSDWRAPIPANRALFWMDPPRPWCRPRGDDDEHMNGVVDVEHENDRADHLLPGTPHKVSVKGTEGVTANVVVKTYRGKVWMSWPPFIWEAIMDSAKVDELVHVLRLVREEATRDGSG
jgi:hypothetical protein